MIKIDVVLVGVGVVRIDMIQNYKKIVPNFYNFKIILAPSVFENYVAFRFFTFTFCCAIPQRDPAR